MTSLCVGLKLNKYVTFQDIMYGKEIQFGRFCFVFTLFKTIRRKVQNNVYYNTHYVPPCFEEVRTESIEFQHNLHKIDSKKHIVQGREVPACDEMRKNVQGMSQLSV